MVTSEAKDKISFRVESARIAQTRRIRSILRKIANASVVTVTLLFLLSALWAGYTGVIGRMAERLEDKFLETTSDMGLNLENIYLSGLNHLSNEEVLSAISDGGKVELAGLPLFELSLSELKEKVEKIGWVKRVDIERKIPNSLLIHVTEREPGAVWQYKGELSLIDARGNIISKEAALNFPDLPVIVGEEANKHANSLFTFLNAEPELMNRVSSIIRIGGRRWNVRLKNDIDIKLPEKTPDEAWRLLAKLQKEKNLLDRAVTTIDLRVPDRMFIQVIPDDESFYLNSMNKAKNS